VQDRREHEDFPVVGNAGRWDAVRALLKASIDRPGSRPILVLGPCGVGKTSGVHACVRELVELCGPDATTPQRVWGGPVRREHTGRHRGRPVRDAVGRRGRRAGRVRERRAALRFATTVPPRAGVVVMTAGTRLPAHMSKLRAACNVVCVEPLAIDDEM
jgi:hypothetical protein